MTARPEVLITGFASIGPAGPSRGLPVSSPAPDVQLIERWPTPGPRRAFLVPRFRPADYVAGLRTRRMDRLSAWTLLGSVLALQDANVDPVTLKGDRTAVVVGTAFGCLDLTEDFLGEVSTHAPEASPILFPETLANLPGSHVARHLAITGPNLTLSAGRLSGEVALLQAASLLEAGEADRALVIAGDTLTRPLFEWYEAASMLDPVCFDGSSPSAGSLHRRLVPGEGVAACLLETRAAASRERRLYGHYRSGWLGPAPSHPNRSGASELERIVAQMLGSTMPDEVEVMLSPASGTWGASAGSEGGPGGGRPAPPLRFLPTPELGHFGGTGLLMVGVALSRFPKAGAGPVAVAGVTGADGQVALVLFSEEPGA